MSDGAAAVLLASRQATKRYNLPVLGKFMGFCAVGYNSEVMDIGPAVTMHQLF